MRSGDRPGLQNRRVASSGVIDGFDSHSLPPICGRDLTCIDEGPAKDAHLRSFKISTLALTTATKTGQLALCHAIRNLKFETDVLLAGHGMMKLRHLAVFQDSRYRYNPSATGRSLAL